MSQNSIYIWCEHHSRLALPAKARSLDHPLMDKWNRSHLHVSWEVYREKIERKRKKTKINHVKKSVLFERIIFGLVVIIFISIILKMTSVSRSLSSLALTSRISCLCVRCLKRRMVLGCQRNQIISWMFCLVLFSSPTVYGFNLDTKTPNFQRGNSGDMFGYSVAQHIDQGQSW
jgi:hypothetical protein